MYVRARAFIPLLTLAILVPGTALAVDTGSADFTNYVSAGDSLTAGVTSHSLIDTSQKNSYPAIIARQATAGAADFEQPLISQPGLPPIMQLTGLFPASFSQAATPGHPENLTLPRLYNNLGVPGETVHSMLTVTSDIPATGAPGAHDLILRGHGTQIQEVVGSKPTFVTLWIGNNDALSAALAGDVRLLTPVASFTADYNAIVGAIASTGAKMAIANIPDVTSIPYVTTIPIVLVDPHTNKPVMVNNNFVPLIGPKGLLVPGDHVLLPASADLAKGLGIPRPIGTGLPLPASDVLLAADAATMNDRVAQFNAVIQAAAQKVGAALIDINAIFKQLSTTGIEEGGIPFSSAYLTGGIISYDGFHATAIGYALTANAFIDAINQRFGGHIPEADLSPAIFGSSAGPGELRVEAGTGEAPEAAARPTTFWTPFIFSAEDLRALEEVMGISPPAGPGGGHHHHGHH